MQRGVKQELPELLPGRGAQTSRGLRRSELILKVAAKLFADNGFDRVSINDIGLAAGITGPAIYRYFASKEALLVSAYESLYQRSSAGMKAILAEDVGALESLEKLVDLQLELALEIPETIRIVDSEERHLPVKEADRFRAENRRQLRIWTELLRQARPDLTPTKCDMTVHGVLALINSITRRRGEKSSPEGVRQHLRAMAMNAIAADVVNERGNVRSA